MLLVTILCSFSVATVVLLEKVPLMKNKSLFSTKLKSQSQLKQFHLQKIEKLLLVKNHYLAIIRKKTFLYMHLNPESKASHLCVQICKRYGVWSSGTKLKGGMGVSQPPGLKICYFTGQERQ